MTYTPNKDFNGEDTIAFTVSDGEAEDDGAVNSINDAPVAGTIADQAATANAAIDLNGLFADVDGDALTLTVAGLPEGLTYDAANGQIVGTPSETGNFTVTITADDGSTSTDTTFNLGVATDDAPTPSEVTIEAESLSLAGFTTANKDFASGGAYIKVKSGTGSASATSPPRVSCRAPTTSPSPTPTRTTVPARLGSRSTAK